jgi:trigger factor
MNITKENLDDLNAILTIEISKPDYEEKVETVLKDYRKKANLKGFRPGMTPIGLIKKMYGTAVKIEEINKLVGESIQKYITDEKLEILGDPLQKIDENETFDFENNDNFSFSFELGLAPVFEIKLSKKNKLYFYEITVDEKMKNGYLDNIVNGFYLAINNVFFFNSFGLMNVAKSTGIIVEITVFHFFIDYYIVKSQLVLF